MAGQRFVRTFLVIAVVVLVASCSRPSSKPELAPVDRGSWQLGALAIDDAEALALTTALATDQPDSALPTTLTANRAPTLAFVSLGDASAPAAVAWARATGVVAAARAAHDAARKRASAGGWLKLDLVTDVRAPAKIDLSNVKLSERTLHGLSLGRGPTEIALLPEELVVQTIIDKAGRLRRKNLEAYLRKRGMDSRLAGDRVQARRFRVRSFFHDGARALALYRGHRRLSHATVPVLTASLAAAGAYLARSVDSEGRFVYSYLAKSDVAKSSYNMVRHAGTVYAMFELHHRMPTPELRAAGQRALDYMLRSMPSYPAAGAGVRVLAHGGKVKLGGVALAAVALAKYIEATGDRSKLAVAQGLVRYIKWSQKPDGSFVHTRTHPGGKSTGFVSQYYPGEALLALARVHALDRASPWMDVAERGARFLIEVRDKGIVTKDLVHDHWLLYALNEIYRQRKRPAFLEHAMRISTAIVAGQRRSPAQRDHVGSFRDPPRSTPVATRVEGLMAALKMARDFRPSMVEPIAGTVRRGVAFELITQVTPERAMYLANPKRALGGFTRSLTNFEIRIDYVQHNISALLAYKEWLSSSAKKPASPAPPTPNP